MEDLGLVLLVIVGIGIYLLPTWIACARKRINKGAIFCLNLFIGWSLVAWVIAMVWAVKEPENSAK